MRRIRSVMLALVALMAFSGIMAVTAQAKPAFWKIKTVELKAGEKKAAKLKGGASALVAGTFGIDCETVEAKGNILGGAPGGGELGKIKYSGCKNRSTSNGEKCELSNKAKETKIKRLKPKRSVPN